MRIVIWTDKHGWKHASKLRDKDPDDMAPSGIPLEPPDVNEIDWEGVKKDLHNQLIDKRLFTWDDVVAQQTGVTAAIQSAIKRRLINFYRREDADKRKVEIEDG